MRKFLNTILGILPYIVMLVLTGAILIIIYRKDLSFEQVKDLISVLIWPAVVLIAFLFFRKVITYLFFSMESFGFFGTQGKLKDIREVINEQVEQRLQEQKLKEEQEEKVGELQERLDAAEQSKADSKTEAAANLELARNFFQSFKKLSEDHAKVLQELNDFRRKKAEREARMAAIRERVRRRRLEEEPSQEEIDAAGDAYMQRYLDERRGK